MQRSPQTIYVSATPRPYELEKNPQVVEQLVRPTGLVDPPIEVRPAGSQVDDVMSAISGRISANDRVFITPIPKRMAAHLTESRL